MNPGLTQYDKRINYQTYDITDKLRPGRNGVGVTISSGWWCDAQTFVVKNYNYFGDKEALLAKIEVTYEDGSRIIATTNTKEWKYFGDGPYRYAGFFLGEQYDAAKKDIYTSYSLPDFDDSKWEPPVTEKPEKIEELRTMPPGFGRTWPAVNDREPELIGGYDAPVYIVDTKQAQTCTELEGNVFLYDLGQEMAGVPRIRFCEKPGTKIVIRYAEVLYPHMPEYAGNEGKMIMRGIFRLWKTFRHRRDSTRRLHLWAAALEVLHMNVLRFSFHGGYTSSTVMCARWKDFIRE